MQIDQGTNLPNFSFFQYFALKIKKEVICSTHITTAFTSICCCHRHLLSSDAYSQISVAIRTRVLNCSGNQIWQILQSAFSCHLLECFKGSHSSVDLSAPTILRSWVRIPSTPHLRLWCIWHWVEKRTKIKKKRPGLAHFFIKK